MVELLSLEVSKIQLDKGTADMF